MKYLLLLLIALPTLFLLESSQIKKGPKELKIGKKAPLASVQLEGIDGNAYSLNDLNKSNGLIVVFSCNTCPFVVGNDNFEGWEKQYNALYKKASENNIGMVLLNSNEAKRENEDSKEEMVAHAKKQQYAMPYLIDTDSKLADAFGAKTTPHVYVFNADMKLVYKGSIDNSWDSKRTELRPYLYEAIDYLKNGTELKENATPPRGCSIKRTK